MVVGECVVCCGEGLCVCGLCVLCCFGCGLYFVDLCFGGVGFGMGGFGGGGGVVLVGED